MRMKRISAAVALTAVGALVISGCAATEGGGDDSGLVEGSSITAAWEGDRGPDSSRISVLGTRVATSIRGGMAPVWR